MLLSLQSLSAKAQEEGHTIGIGERFSLASEVLGENRAYWIHLPASYNDTTYVPQRYPVLYLLDGDTDFHFTSGVVQVMSKGSNLQIPELIVVGIPNVNRTRDLTPTHSKTGLDSKESRSLASSGGGNAFLKFLRDELIEHIDKTYRTLPYRVLVGHSLSGLFVLYAFLDAPEVFQAYIAMDPSLWWDDQVVVRRAMDTLKTTREPNATVYISLANHPDLGLLDDPSLPDVSVKTFAKILECAAAPHLRSTLQYFEAEDHNSVPLLSLYHGLLYVFGGYKPSLAEWFEQPTTLITHFRRVSEGLGVELLPPEKFVNRAGLLTIRQLGDTDKAIELFKINVSNYPNSYNAYASLAKAYEVNGETQLAIENYEKSLELKPDHQNSKERLRELGAQE